MDGNSVFPVVFWSSFFGALAWLPFFTPVANLSSYRVHISNIDMFDQLVILIKSIAMTSSWLFAYFSIRELPLSFSGAVRASGPLWTLAGGMIVFNEFLTALQLSAVFVSVFAYFLLSRVGKSEGLVVLKSTPMAMMLCATILSALATVYDKFIIQNLGLPIADVQAWSAIHRFLLAAIVFLVVSNAFSEVRKLRWSIWIPLTGLSWVFAEWLYFLAVVDPVASVTYLAIFRRMSLVVGFLLSVLLIGEQNVIRKAVIIGLILASTVTLIFEH